MKKAEAFSINTICPDLFKRILRPGVGVVGGEGISSYPLYVFRVQNLFGNNLSRIDLPYSKEKF